MRRVVILLTALFVLAVPATASAAELTKFGRLFPNLAPLNQHSDLDLADLAQAQQDPNLDAANNCTNTALPPVIPDSGCVFSIMTYGGGQFFDHDITLDRQPSPFAAVDPTTLTNFRTFKLDLDSVYCGGPSVTPDIFVGNKFKVQNPNLNGVRDYARGPDGKALLCEGRNDENQIIAQFHLGLLFFHNRLIDEGMSFGQAQLFLTLHYQKAVVKELSENTLSVPFTDQRVQRLANQAKLKNQNKAFTPIEFSVAAFRYGHSNVRRAYRLNAGPLGNCPNLQVFAASAPGVEPADLRGGRQLQAGRQIDWGMFDSTLPEPAGCEGLRNIQRKFDELISSSLFLLPNPFVADRNNVLGFLNMVRAKHYGLPSGQAVAAELGLPVLTAEELGLDANLAARFAGGVPLWFYVLRESQVRENGQRLGPTGSLIVAAGFQAMLEADKDSILRQNQGFVPDPRVAGPDGEVELTDLQVFAGTAR